MPIDEVLAEVRSALREPPHAAVLVAPPGAGKTTGVPLALLEDESLRAGGGTILVTEPRRVATRAAARRMAWLRNEEVGRVVGYRTRFEKCVDAAETRIEVVTEGILTRRLQVDAALRGVSAVLLDEFHERGLEADLGLTLCIHSKAARQRAGLPPLRVVVMSATLAPELRNRLAQLLGGAAVIQSEGRSYNVEVRHLEPERWLRRAAAGFEARGLLEKAVAGAARSALRETRGNVLCFLPGEGEIRQAAKALEGELLKEDRRSSKDVAAAAVKKAERRPARRNKAKGFGVEAPPQQRPGAGAKAGPLGPVDVLQLYGSLPAEEQDRAIQPGLPGRRRVVLATNVAEASVTVAGITAVVDAGLRRRSRFSRASGFDVLDTVPISEASAKQRAGRAGRLEDGLCFRLWNQSERLRPSDVPDIAEVELTGALLSLLACGIRLPAVGRLPWLDAPPQASLDYAASVLRTVGALSEEDEITELGRAISDLPLHPRLGFMALNVGSVRGAGSSTPHTADLADLCALLEEDRDVLRGANGKPAAPASVDVCVRLRALHGDLPERLPGTAAGTAGQPLISGGAAARLRRSAQELRRRLPEAARHCSASDPGPFLALAFSDRVAVRLRAGSGFRMPDGATLSVKDFSLLDAPALVVLRQRDSVVMLAAPLQLEDLSPGGGAASARNWTH